MKTFATLMLLFALVAGAAATEKTCANPDVCCDAYFESACKCDGKCVVGEVILSAIIFTIFVTWWTKHAVNRALAEAQAVAVPPPVAVHL